MTPPLKVHLENTNEFDRELGLKMGIYPDGYPDDHLLNIDTRWVINGDQLEYKTCIVHGHDKNGDLTPSAVHASKKAIEAGIGNLDKYTLDENSIAIQNLPNRGVILVDDDGNRVG